jgi:hypothetical protein
MKCNSVKYTLRISQGLGDGKYDYEVLEAELQQTDDTDTGDMLMTEARRICIGNSTAAIKAKKMKALGVNKE